VNTRSRHEWNAAYDSNR